MAELMRDLVSLVVRSVIFMIDSLINALVILLFHYNSLLPGHLVHTIISFFISYSRILGILLISLEILLAQYRRWPKKPNSLGVFA